ncbi:hypothetical protein FA09DRAFT_359368 [Tilletiopsis washingtonensis]|uniref:Small ribosomal subunit protein mS41 n=1 Tax=Tilletiopsis washingtonensis TaxID=58919 RepID=A0A316ZC21_9BASI|nr:hypothetical protein FA09DRAFT_359368 [Tilletiopsis washingtonensis]PWN99327.1 hypothetical protein FA09DRAFT_359368 [Tilletiopsis washingtonensis]
MSQHLLSALRAPLRPYARTFASGASSSQAAAAAAAVRPVASPPQSPQLSPAAFLAAIARPPSRPDLSGDAKLVALLSQQSAAAAPDAAGEAALKLDVQPKQLKEAGVTVQMRRYLLWSLNKLRAGEDPASFPQGKKPKRVRGWGPRVQKGIRVRGVRRAGEK